MSDLEIVPSSENRFERNARTTFDAVYDTYNTENEAVNIAQGNIAAENENTIDEEVYEDYDGDYQEYRPQYATNSNKSESIMQKFLKNKMIAISVLLIVCTIGIAVGLTCVHFTQSSTIAVASNTTVSRTTTVSPIDTASARGTLFSIKLNKLNVILCLLFISAYT